MIRIQYEIRIPIKSDRFQENYDPAIKVEEILIERPHHFHNLEDAIAWVEKERHWLRNPKIVEVTTKILKEFN